jgi:hypothetical protein
MTTVITIMALSAWLLLLLLLPRERARERQRDRDREVYSGSECGVKRLWEANVFFH